MNKKIIGILLATLPLIAEDLGRINFNQAIGFDADTNATSHSFVFTKTQNTNDVVALATTTTNSLKMPILDNQGKFLQGQYYFYAYSVNSEGARSSNSLWYSGFFVSGYLKEPTNFKIFTVVNAYATNNIPPVSGGIGSSVTVTNNPPLPNTND